MDIQINNISEKLKGVPKTTVKLLIERPWSNEKMEKKIIREEIKINSIPYYGIVEPGIGYICVTKFTPEVSSELKDALKNLQSEHQITSLIIDMRGNPGGLLNEAPKICNIFVEKPISHNFDQMGELVSLLNKNKLHFFMGSNWKFHPAFKKMKEVIDSKILGRILSFTVIFGQYLPDWHPWEDYRKGYSANKRLGGGILLDSHEFDYIQWFLGPIRTVAGFCGKHTDLEIDTEDIAEAIVKLESGAIGNIHVDYLQRPYRRSFYFYGEQGSMEWDFSSNEIKVYKLDKKEWEITRIDPSYELNQMYKDEISHFLNILAGKEASLSNIEDAVRILKVIEAVKNSSKEGIVVTL